jgi:peptidoglycan/xylan/chitin deacetylase (PgdA/CDA1 family)
VLGERGLRATFFVVGQALREHRALAERAHAEGHWIGNHTWSHPRPLGSAGAGAVDEIATTQALIGDLAHPDKLFRPSGSGGDLEPGLVNDAVMEKLVAGGYTCVLWNAVPRDWEDPGWVETALRQLSGQEWTVLVLHDVAGAAADRLEEFLDRAAEVTIRQDFSPSVLPIVRGRHALD